MTFSLSAFETDGYLIIPQVLSPAEVVNIASHLQAVPCDHNRTRKLLALPWCLALAKRIRRDHQIAQILPSQYVPIQASYFPKTTHDNWQVALHRDHFVPVAERRDVAGWNGWSIKEGVQFARPPTELLQQLIAVRIHLEANTLVNGPLYVVPRSHISAVETGRTACEVPAGGALAMRPLILHASSKVQAGSRRVLHFLFGPQELPDGLRWAYPDSLVRNL